MTPDYDEIGPWTEVKLEILRKYAAAYSKILSNQTGFTHSYIDGFAGAGLHLSRSSGEWVPGSPLNALRIEPPFKRYVLIDLDGGRVAGLRRMIGDRRDVEILEGDANRLLLDQVFPRIRHERRERALCLLDPYKLQLDWRVAAAAGRSRAIELFLNFPIMDINRAVLRRNPSEASAASAARMTTFWGDESWREVAYLIPSQGNLFGEAERVKASNEVIVQAFRTRLRDVAGFKNVPDPMPMRNSSNAVIYYLFFASPNDVGNKIVRDIFNRFERPA